jgi:transposase
MTTAHRKQAQWTPERITNWAQSIGSSTLEVTKHLLASKKHPEQAYRTCLGLLSLAKRYGNDRLEAACAYACERGTKTRKSIVSILEHGFDKQQPILQPEIQFGDHANVRGSSYYH